MQTTDSIDQLIADIQYKNWTFRTGSMGDGRFVQVRFMAPDCKTGEMEPQAGRKWYLSRHMTDSEVVQTVFLAIKVAEQHELHENFLFRGAQIFCPHYDVTVLAETHIPHDARQHLELSA